MVTVDRELVFRLRALERLTQEAFGKRVGVSGATISDIERGIKSVSRGLALRIVAEFGLTPESEQKLRKLPV